MFPRHVLVFLWLSLVATGCVQLPIGTSSTNHLSKSVEAVLREATAMELISLEPSPGQSEEGFHGYKVLGRTQLLGPGQRSGVASEVLRGISESDGSAAACFLPRHGIHATYKGQTVDLLLCFECSQIRAYRVEAKTEESVLTSGRAQELLDTFLKRAGVPLAKKP